LGSGFVDKTRIKKSAMICFSRKTWVLDSQQHLLYSLSELRSLAAAESVAFFAAFFLLID
jgi:hypothetical protein